MNFQAPSLPSYHKTKPGLYCSRAGGHTDSFPVKPLPS